MLAEGINTITLVFSSHTQHVMGKVVHQTLE